MTPTPERPDGWADGFARRSGAAVLPRAFGAASSVEHEVIGGADHGLSQRMWRRAWGERLVRWVTTRLPAGAFRPVCSA